MLAKYIVDLRHLDEEARGKLIDELDKVSETGLSMTKELHVYTFFLDETLNPLSIPGLTASMLRRVA